MEQKPIPLDEASNVGTGLTGTGGDLWQVKEHVERPVKNVPVIHDLDVAVAGGGVTGIIAGLTAARQGAKTIVVEPFASLGGNMGPGMFAGGSLHLALHNPEAFENGLGGIPQEFNDRVVDHQDRFVGSDYFRDSKAVPYVATKMLGEAGSEMLVSTMVTDVIKEDGKVRGLFVENKSGTAAVKSKVVIDCTGTADIADRAGAPVIENPKDPSMGVFFAIAGFDDARFQKSLKDRGDLSEDDQKWVDEHAPGSEQYMPGVRKAWESGEFKIVDRVDNFATLEVAMKKPGGDPPLIKARTRVNGHYHPGDGLALSRIQQRMEIYIYDFVSFLAKYVPGFEKSYLFLTSPYFQARGGKCIESERVVTADDVLQGARFDDVVYTYYCDKRFVEGGCDIPYRMFVPKQIDGLLAAGRSATWRGPQLRQRYSMQLMGQATGAAAALAVKTGVEPRNVDIKQLQKTLYDLGSEMAPTKRLQELGLA